MNGKDWILILSALVLSGVLAAVLHMQGGGGGSADTVRVRIDGKLFGEWPLDSDHDEEIVTEYGRNHLSIRDGCAVMTEADCPDAWCMKQGAISRKGETIVCLPHHLVAETVEAAGNERRAEDADAGSRDIYEDIDAVTG